MLPTKLQNNDVVILGFHASDNFAWNGYDVYAIFLTRPDKGTQLK